MNDDIDADDLADFVAKQCKIEKESSKNLAAYVEEEKFCDGKQSILLFNFTNLDQDGHAVAKPKKRRAPGRRDNSKLLSNMNLNEEGGG